MTLRLIRKAAIEAKTSGKSLYDVAVKLSEDISDEFDRDDFTSTAFKIQELIDARVDAALEEGPLQD